MQSELTVDGLAQEIRRVDGNHSLGAGALAEALIPFLSALSDKQAGEVKTKPLEWVDGPPGTYKEVAESPFGHYSVWEISGTGCWSPGKYCAGTIAEGGLAGAKAAAQADYEQRIRSALVDVQAVEPVAWQPRYKQDVIDHHRSIGGDLWEYAMTVYPTKAQAEGYGYGGHEARPLYTHPPLREGEDSAEVERASCRLMQQINRVPTKDISQRDRDIRTLLNALAATRSGSATTASGIGDE